MGLLFLVSCQKSMQQQSPVIISSIFPSTVPYSSIVTITGTGFDATAGRSGH
jgi:hypothetical protein